MASVPLNGGGHLAGYWRTMSALQKHYDGFSLRVLVDIAGPEHRKAIANYLAILVDERVVAFDSAPPTGGLVTHSYRIINSGEAPPLRTRDRGLRQRALWTAIRSLKTFREAELAMAASTDDNPIGRDAAGAYIAELQDAGYLTRVGASADRHAIPIYRLQPGMNSGPRAPIVMREERACFDLNLMRAVNLNRSVTTGRAA